MDKIIDIIKTAYGFNKKEAMQYLKTADPKIIEALKQEQEATAKKTFYND